MILVFLLWLLSSFAHAGENGNKVKTKNLLPCDNKEDCIDQLQDIGIEVRQKNSQKIIQLTSLH